MGMGGLCGTARSKGFPDRPRREAMPRKAARNPMGSPAPLRASSLWGSLDPGSLGMDPRSRRTEEALHRMSYVGRSIATSNRMVFQSAHPAATGLAA